MNDKTFEHHLSETQAKIDALPVGERERLQSLLEDTRQRHHELRESFIHMRESLNEWHLRFQYLLFDREATRRERDELRRRLGEQ